MTKKTSLVRRIVDHKYTLWFAIFVILVCTVFIILYYSNVNSIKERNCVIETVILEGQSFEYETFSRHLVLAVNGSRVLHFEAEGQYMEDIENGKEIDLWWCNVRNFSKDYSKNISFVKLEEEGIYAGKTIMAVLPHKSNSNIKKLTSDE